MNQIIKLDQKYNLIDKIKTKIIYIQKYPKLSEMKTKLSKINSLEEMYIKELETLKKTTILLEDDLKNKENELKKINKDLYSGLIKDIKLLDNIKNKEINLEESKEIVERDLINNMDEMENLNTKIQKCKIKSVELKQIIENLNQKIIKKTDEYTKKIHVNLNQIEELKSEINNDDLIKYDNIKNKHKNALVKVENNICGGCNVELFMNKISKLDNNEIIECENCGRLMYK
ncbi:zinc ribbon domain-containing protein [Tepidibacter sp. Z1-5]|uniref:zinc ribbon domain-containing protein n=1 Tax=Tepidibacter sp. Z1-5 TaxID=3134138 RepID=UPI0030C544AD